MSEKLEYESEWIVGFKARYSNTAFQAPAVAASN